MSTINDTPRRCFIDKNTAAEKAIRNAMSEVEKVGADVKLTEVTFLLEKARNVLGDYVDAQFAVTNNNDF